MKQTCEFCRHYENPDKKEYGLCANQFVYEKLDNPQIYPEEQFGCIFFEKKEVKDAESSDN